MVFADSENFQVDTKFSLEKQKKHKALVTCKIHNCNSNFSRITGHLTQAL